MYDFCFILLLPQFVMEHFKYFKLRHICSYSVSPESQRYESFQAKPSPKVILAIKLSQGYVSLRPAHEPILPRSPRLLHVCMSLRPKELKSTAIASQWCFILEQQEPVMLRWAYCLEEC